MLIFKLTMLVKGPLSSTIMLFQLMTDSPKGTKPLIIIHVMIYILYKLTLKFKLWYLTAILICGRFCNKEVSKIVFTWNIITIRFIFLNRMKCGFFVQLSRTDYQDKDNGQHTGSVIPRFAGSSWGTLTFTLHKFNYMYKNTEINVIYINNYSK